MKWKKVAYKLHLWIGMISGIIVFIVCITGAIWALNIYGWVDKEPLSDYKIFGDEKFILPPSQLVNIAEKTLEVSPTYISYRKDSPVRIGSYGKVRTSVLLNPYTGQVIDGQSLQKNESSKFNFWNFIRQGHRALWLPWNIGRPIVNYGTLAFVIVLITGVIIWAPKSKKGIKNKLYFNWKKTTPNSRKLFDLHRVLGFYISFILLAIAMTGMVWGLSWWSSGLYKVTSGGVSLPKSELLKSDTVNVDTTIHLLQRVDEVLLNLKVQNPSMYEISIGIPTENDGVITVALYPEKDVYYNADRYTFDRYTLANIQSNDPYAGKYKDASFANKLRRMNYEIHIGSIWGTTGRLLVFFGALFGASLPLTGFYIFYKKHKRKK